MVKTIARIHKHNRDIKEHTLIPLLLKGANEFEVDKKTYLINPNCIMWQTKIPWWGFGIIKKTYKVLEYIEGSPSPISLPNLEGVEKIGVSDAELSKIFDPRFWEIIAKATNKNQQYLLYIGGATLLAMLYVVYQVSKILAAVEAMRQAMGV
jgi:hypothetical protein